MNKVIQLREIAKYSDKRIKISDIALDDFITTDNLLQNKFGITKATNLPPQNGTIPLYEKGNILIGNIRPYLKKIWYADRKGGASPDVLTLQINDKYDSKYIYYALFRDDFFNHMMKGAKGTKMPRGDKNQVLEFLIPNYDITTQKKIAAILSALDNKVQINNRINTELETMAKTIYNYWFVQFDFPDAEGNPYKTSGGEMIWNEGLKREIPKIWEVGTLSDIGNIIGGSTPSKEDISNFTNNGIAWITPKDLSVNVGNKFITKGEIDVSERGLKNGSLNIMPIGTVLLSSRAPIGYMAIARTQVTTNQGFKSFIPKEGYTTPFIYYTVKDLIPSIENKASGSTFKEVSASILKSIDTFLPDKTTIKEFTKVLNPIFKKQDIIELENQQLSSLRDWLLPMLMNGQVIIE